MTKELDAANKAVDAARKELSDMVNNNGGDLDLDAAYEILRRVQEAEKARNAIAELNYAFDVLKRHGVVYKVWGREAVLDRLMKLAGARMSGEEMEKVADHATQGDDWSSLGEETTDEDALVWQIIKGTAHDHPEWFPPSVLEQL